MAKFKYRSRGTANEDWHEDVIEAEDIGEAEDKLDEIYSIKRDDNGDQINKDAVIVEILNK